MKKDIKRYSDYELLSILEANNKKPSYKNLEILKEGLLNGTIVLEEEKKEKVEEPVEEKEIEEIPEEKVSDEEIQQDVRVSIEMPSDGSLNITNQDKTVAVDPEGNVHAELLEASKFGFYKGSEKLLKSFLTEDCEMPLKEYEVLREDTKFESIKEIAVQLLKSIEEKIMAIDTSSADRSRGDIKQLKELPAIQDVITKLEALLERDETAAPEYSEAVSIIIKAILYINQYSAVFKEGYRNKKILVILKYQSLILSIISAVTYVLSTIIDFKDEQLGISHKNELQLDIAPLKSLSDFIKSVESGEFKKATNDVAIVREYYLEVPVETMGSILEANNYLPMIIDGVKNIYNSLDNNGKLMNLFYKATGVIVLLFSLRDALYTIFRMRTKVTDMLNAIQGFANINNGAGGSSILNKLSTFANKFRNDTEFNSDITKREIEDENRRLLGQVKQVQAAPAPIVSEPSETTVQPETSNSDSMFGFDF